MSVISDASIAQLFTAARTQNAWRDEAVTDDQISAIYDLAKMGPTSANCSPARFIFLKTPEARARLLPHMAEGNRAKTGAAPMTVIIGMDLQFFEHLPRLFPHADAKAWFAGKPAFARETALRNGSLQGAYFMLAARAVGLDCGPMSGFNAAGVNTEFFPDGRVEANFICNLGHGDPAGVKPRLPRLSFEEACPVL